MEIDNLHSSRSNKHGLPRTIPCDVEREVRQRSKFGCVICRSGFYQYEHINPTFEDATEHHPDNICCLCGSCHDAVTRNRISKGRVAAAYRYIQGLSPDQVAHPTGPLDFYDGSAQLEIAGLVYPSAIPKILRYFGSDIITATPGHNGEPGKISAIFTDNNGKPTLFLDENQWIGSPNNWDIETSGPRITVRRCKREIVLKIRLDPPGRLVIERLDMRIGNHHILISEKCYAIGLYLENEQMAWTHASIRITGCNAHGAVIDILSPEQWTKRLSSNSPQGLTSAMGNITISADGVAIPPMSLVIASNTGGLMFYNYSLGFRTLREMRNKMKRNPSDNELNYFLGSSTLKSS